MPNWSSTYVESADGLRLHVTRTGAGDKPPLVLAHGFSDDGLCWSALARALEAEYDVVMPDARGHGQSEPPQREFSYLDLADDLAALISGLGLNRPIVLGHSMGAAMAMFLAARHPTLPHAIALEDPPAWWPPAAAPMFDAEWRANEVKWLSSAQQQSRDQLIATGSDWQPQWRPEELPPWAESKLAFNLSFLEYARPPAIDWLGDDWPARAPAISCPVLLITGDPTRWALISDAQAEALKAWLPQVERGPIAGAGHCIRRDQPEAYLAALRSWLAEQVTGG